MPQELLRDVLRTDDAAGRSRRRWVLFPTSVAVHAVAAVAYFIIPLAAEVTMPTPASLLANRRWVMPVAPTTPRPPSLQRASDAFDCRRADRGAVEARARGAAHRGDPGSRCTGRTTRRQRRRA